MPWAVLRPLLAGAPGGEDAAMGRLRAYALELLKWNRGVSNLISRHDESRLVERHMAESLAPASLLRESGCARFLDLGSGAGLPAIPLAIAGVGEHWELVESRRNKTLFIRKALQQCQLSGIVVTCSRLETLLEESASDHACDGFTSRATLTVGPTLELAARCVGAGGKAFLWKGSSFEQEMRESAEIWGRDWMFVAAHTILAGPNVVVVFSRR
jgi:16S rRNA (guanine527-N7)-methyltransferase